MDNFEPTILHHAHDGIAKFCLSNLSIARDFLKAHLPESIKKICDFSTLSIETSTHIDEKLKQKFSDILYSLQIDSEPAYVYCLVEHQSSVEELMPFRMLCYQSSIMQRHLDKGNKKLPLVIPLLFYHGRRSPYPYSVRLKDCFSHPALAEKLLFKELCLIDLTVLQEDEIMSHRRASLLEMVQKHIFAANILEHLDSIKRALSLIKLYPELQSSAVPMIYYLYKKANVPDVGQLIEHLTQKTTDYQEDAMTAAEYLIQKGRQEGIEQGMQQGIQKGQLETQLEIARKLSARGMDKALIKDITGIDLMNIQ